MKIRVQPELYALSWLFILTSLTLFAGLMGIALCTWVWGFSISDIFSDCERVVLCLSLMAYVTVGVYSFVMAVILNDLTWEELKGYFPKLKFSKKP
jgi:hypothetical protein